MTVAPMRIVAIFPDEHEDKIRQLGLCSTAGHQPSSTLAFLACPPTDGTTSPPPVWALSSLPVPEAGQGPLFPGQVTYVLREHYTILDWWSDWWRISDQEEEFGLNLCFHQNMTLACSKSLLPNSRFPNQGLGVDPREPMSIKCSAGLGLGQTSMLFYEDSVFLWEPEVSGDCS